MKKKIKQSLKFATMMTYIGGYVGSRVVGNLMFSVTSPVRRRKKLLFVDQFWSRRALNLMGVKTTVKGENLPKNCSHLIVCNHLSYLDIVILQALYPSCFVTSVEVKESHGLGHLVKLGGCLFVERRNKHNIHNEIREITEALEQNLSVTIFPEATSTNGERVLRFRRPLYNAAIFSGRPVKPLCINYKSIDGKKISPRNRDHIFWYDDMEFVSHLWNLLGAEGIEVEVSRLKEIFPEKDIDAAALALSSQALVEQVYVPVIHREN